MKTFRFAPLAFVLLAAGCARPDSADPRRHHASHHRAAPRDPNAPTPTPGPAGNAPPPQDAGVPNPDLGPGARDSQGHPAISDY